MMTDLMVNGPSVVDADASGAFAKAVAQSADKIAARLMALNRVVCIFKLCEVGQPVPLTNESCSTDNVEGEDTSFCGQTPSIDWKLDDFVLSAQIRAMPHSEGAAHRFFGAGAGKV